MFSADFPRFPTGEFTPLFRLLDDYATHQGARTRSSPSLSSFKPAFDIKENKDNYELHGELPGIDQKDVQIEFSDASTLTIKGRTERYTESGTPPSAGFIEGSTEQGKLTDNNEHYRAPSVEEETAGGESSAVATSSASDQVASTNKAKSQPQSRYWVSERSVGEFHRAFSFPTRVDHDNVKASLKNGILSIIVPKSQAPTTRRINIE
ncbi:HSP20-like chaperone [Delphinella strobiligena]|nr:HSP20-like chaperone [Delphinella strobiligena]